VVGFASLDGDDATTFVAGALVAIAQSAALARKDGDDQTVLGLGADGGLPRGAAPSAQSSGSHAINIYNSGGLGPS